MRTSGEINVKCQTTTGTLKVSINKRTDGKFLVSSSFFDADGFYIAHKSGERIAESIDELIDSDKFIRY